MNGIYITYYIIDINIVNNHLEFYKKIITRKKYDYKIVVEKQDIINNITKDEIELLKILISSINLEDNKNVDYEFLIKYILNVRGFMETKMTYKKMFTSCLRKISNLI
jgi:hypothetical protein